MLCGTKVAVVAHRGASREAPENTLSAIRLAIARGVDACEVDVQATADGVLVLLHDEDLARVTRDPRSVWRLSYAEVQRLEAGSWFSRGFAGEPIPRLEQVLDLARGCIALTLELKFRSPDLRDSDVTLVQKNVGPAVCRALACPMVRGVN
jgi:glycerophosphoryl diester phosphodiesterase